MIYFVRHSQMAAIVIATLLVVQGCLIGADPPLDEDIPMAEALATEANLAPCADGSGAREDLNGLCWRVAENLQEPLGYNDAEAYCADLPDGEWRLPTNWEFGTIFGGCSFLYSMIDSVAWQCTPCRQSEVCFDIFQTAIAEYDVQDSESDLMYFTDDNGSALVVVEREDDQSEVLPFSDYSSFAVVCVREE